MKRKSKLFVATLTLISVLLASCGTNPEEVVPTGTPEVTETPEATEEPEATATVAPTATPEPTPTPAPQTVEEMLAGMKLSSTLKKFGYDTPAMTQRYGADPCAMVYDGRVYIYMTGDVVEYRGGKAIENTYSKINTINVISSDDLVNWTDHGTIYAAGKDGAARWGGNSWAPTAAYKEIDGQMKFFLYFANNGNGIGVLTADSPVGPFTDPIGKALISRGTPNCAMMNTAVNSLSTDISIEVIAHERIFLVLKRSLPAAEALLRLPKAEVGSNLHLLADTHLIALDRNLTVGSHVDNFLARNYINFPHRLNTTNNATAIELAAKGLGFCFLVESGLADLSRYDDLVALDLHSRDLMIPLSIVRKRERFFSLPEQELCDLIRKYYRSLLAEEQT